MMLLMERSPNLLEFFVWLCVMGGSLFLGMRTTPPEIDPLGDQRAPFLFLRSFKETVLKDRPTGTMRAGVHRLSIGHNLAELLEQKQCLGRVLVLQEEPRRKTTPSWTGYSEEDPPDLIVIREDDVHWFETIERLVRRCRTIILLPGTTAGLMEEFHLLTSRRLLDRVLVLMPPLSRAWLPDEDEEQRFRARWRALQRELDRGQGCRLPDYEPEGMLYRPNFDLSVKEVRSLGSKLDGLNAALRDLTTVRDQDCTPLSELLAELLAQGYERETANIFKRKTE